MASVSLVTVNKTNALWQAQQQTVNAVIASLPTEPIRPTLVTIPGSGVVRMRLNGRTVTQDDYTHTLHAVYIDRGAATEVNTNELLADIAAYVINALATWLTQAVADWAIDTVTTYVYDATVPGWVPTGEVAVNQPGQNVTYNSLPPDVASKVKVLTGLAGLRGGFAWGAFNENHNSADGVIETSVVSLIADLAEDFYQLYVGTKFDLYPGVWSKTYGTFGVYAGLTVNNIWDSIASRKPGVGA